MDRCKPYYAVIFKSKRTPGDNGYEVMSERAVQAATKLSGFLGADSVRGADGLGLTVSYWDSRESIETWKRDALHREVKAGGLKQWYSEYAIRICKVEYENFFEKADP